MIIAISGLSGSGKSTIAKSISECLNIPLVISCTTRPPRPGEINGIDYHFMSIDEFAFTDVVARQDFVVANGETWSYGFRKNDLKNDCIAVMTPSGIEELKKIYEREFIDIMIAVDDNIRMKRIFDRHDNQSKEEIERRDKADKILFKKYIPSIVVYNNGSLDDAIKIIARVLK